MKSRSSTAKRRRSRLVEKYLVNPQVRFALRRGFAPHSFALLETRGRRTGKVRHTPVGNGTRGDTFWLVAEHGWQCGYVRNLAADPHVRVKVGRRWRTGTAHFLPDDDGLARRADLDAANGAQGRFDGWIFRKNATAPLTIRIDLIHL